MVDPVVIPTLYFLAVLQLVFQALIFFYAYRVTKITGSFRAWTLIVLGLAILTIRNVVSLVLTLTLPVDQVSSLIDSVGVTSIIVSTFVDLAAGLVMFLGFFGLVRRFQSQPKPA